MQFLPGELDREIARRGLSVTEFAAKAGIDRVTLYRARNGGDLRHATFGSILKALGSIRIPKGVA